MALSNFTELKNSVAAWLTRQGDSDLIALIPDFIALCEDELNRTVRIRAMEHRATMAVAAEYVALPNNFREMRRFTLLTDPVTKLTPVAPEYIASVWAGAQTGTPRVFAIVRGEVQLAPAPDQTYTAEMVYWGSLAALTEANPAPDLLLLAPRVYLYGTMRQAAIYLEDDEKKSRYEPEYLDAVQKLQVDDEKQRYSGAQLVARPVGITPA